MKRSLFTRFSAVLLVAFSVACAPPAPPTNATTTPEKAAPSAAATAATVVAAPTEFPTPEGQAKSLEVTTAEGAVQIYTCAPKKDNPDQFEWTLKAPEATLLDSKGYKVGKHYGGPTWEGNDGSKVIGIADKRQSKPAPNAIPWLFLPAKAEGKGIFSGVEHIQRLHTEGGVAPATGCDKTTVGKEERVKYKATYYFYQAKSQTAKAPEAKAPESKPKEAKTK